MAMKHYKHKDIVAFAEFYAEQRGRLGFYAAVQCALLAIQRELEKDVSIGEALRRTVDHFPEHRSAELSAVQRFAAWAFATGRLDYMWTLDRRTRAYHPVLANIPRLKAMAEAAQRNRPFMVKRQDPRRLARLGDIRA